MSRLWSRVGVRTASVGLLVAGALAGFHLGQDREVAAPQTASAAQLAFRADATEMRLLKTRQNEHVAARARRREAETDAAAKAARAASGAATKSHRLEQKIVEKKAAEKKAADEAKEAEGSGKSVPFDGPIPTSCKEFSGNRATGCALMLEAGFGIDQFPCLNQLWNRESGWNARATNRSSGAYGIPQAYPGSKMASVAADWRTNPATQIKWGLGYVKGRYNTPCGAWSHFQSAGSY